MNINNQELNFATFWQIFHYIRYGETEKQSKSKKMYFFNQPGKNFPELLLHINIFIYTCIYTYLYKYVSIRIFTNVHLKVYMKYVYIYVSISIYIYIYICVHIYILSYNIACIVLYIVLTKTLTFSLLKVTMITLLTFPVMFPQQAFLRFEFFVIHQKSIL